MINFFQVIQCPWHATITRTHKKMFFDPDLKELGTEHTSQSIRSPMSLPGVQKVPPLEPRSCMVALLPWTSTVIFKSCYQEIKKANEKSLSIITSKHIDLESKCSKEIILTCPSSCRDHGSLCGTPSAETWERIWIPGALLSITDNSYQLQQGIRKDGILKKGNRKKKWFFFFLITHFQGWHTADSNWNNKMHFNILYCIDHLMVSF